ncbi:coproporphyrinogen III oxidase [Malaciobacter mytili LMG 24559]|uniref:Heme chaperone HemW n=1 Tax=Malaciobacter mytili LMG 24559 TaxID=1032238 RepID=A0AAX2AI86_9BACT|nr:radical SAM family heme chaperone HemW [Malaciobacter mytili]AXH15051.1 oxygen-independent coproporphyrinogen III oxidase [Malaciobacter mytili LMG 24559]RXK16734.1 coproporphyrinogen III oxidase [Malaciobacter mytili LMG 24559]
MLLYIHIPFCDSKCHYCAFNSYTDRFHLKHNYMQALIKQLEFELKYLDEKNEKLQTVFIGGGTPSSVKFEEYKEVFKLIKPYLTENCEITTEANPNSASIKWLEGMKSFGVNRVSFGVQSFNNEKLKKLGRSHNNKSAIEAIQNAKNVGFEKINCDIIYGVQDDSFESLKKDFDMAFSLPINHLSAYSLTIEEGTKFFNKSNIKIDDEELSYKIFEYFEKNGFIQYEISNFAKSKEAESKHNYGYWQHKEYLGVGAGAVGYKNSYRYYPLKGIEEYILTPTKYKIEDLSIEDIKVEKTLLGFRCSTGVELSIFNKEELEKINYLVEENKLKLDKYRVFNKNFLLADELALYILE